MKNLIVESYQMTKIFNYKPKMLLLICFFAGAVYNLNSEPLFLSNNNDLAWELGVSEEDVATEMLELQALACKPSIQVSLNQLGLAEITPSMLVSGPDYPLNQYEVDIMGPLTNMVSCMEIGEEVMAVLEEIPTGNTCMTLITVQDKLKPMLVCTGDTIACNVDIDTIDFSSFIDVLEDNCDNDVSLIYNFTITPLECNPDDLVAFIKVNWTATDDYNNFTSCSDTLFLKKPTLDEVIFPADTTLNCVDADPDPAVIGGPTVWGGPIDHTCKLIAFKTDNVIPMCSGMTKIIRIWTVMDWCTNLSRTGMQEILIEDTTAPVIVCPVNANISTNTLNCVRDYTLIPPASVTDDCSDNNLIEIEIFVQGIPGAFSPGDVVELGLGQTLITIRATDDCQNSSTCMYAVNVVDDVPPSAVCSNIQTSIAQSGVSTVLANNLQFNPFDNCGVLKVEVARMTDLCNNPDNLVFDEEVTFCCADVGTSVMVAYQITDVNGNVNTCMFEAEVKDVLPPVALCKDIEISVSGSGAVTVSANDIDNGSTDNCVIVSRTVNPNSFDCGDIGIQVVTLTVTDASNNSSTCSANVTVIDTIPPVAECTNFSVNLNNMGIATITVFDVDGGSTDNCGIDTMYISDDTFTCADIGPNLVTLIVEDEFGNIDSCIAIVTVVEAPPSAFCQNVTVYLDSNGDASVLASQVNNNSTDDCGIDTMTVAPNDFGCADLGSNVVTLTVTDISDNSATCSATVTVVDTLAPMCVVQNITVYLDALGQVSIMSTDIDNGSSDNCSVVDFDAQPMDFNCSNVGPNMVDLVVADAMMNTDTCTAIVTVLDTLDPICLSQDLTIYLNLNGTQAISAFEVNNGSNDNCGFANVEATPLTFDCDDAGNVVVVTLTVTDASMNSSTCTANVTVQDTFPPQAICMDASIMLDATGNATITTADINNGSIDNCDNNLDLSLNQTSFDCDDIGMNIVVLTVTDDNGTSATCSANVVVADNLDPNAICQNIDVMLGVNGMATITAADVDGGSTDNCSVVISATPLTFDCDDVGPNNVTLTATDPSNNTDDCISIVTVMENVDPTALCQNVVVMLDANGMGSITVNDVDNGSNDNCGTPSLALDILNFNCTNIGMNNVILTVTDGAGNVDTCHATVTVVDNIDPIAICMNATVYVDAMGNVSITSAQINNGSTDNCGDPAVSLDMTDFGCDDLGTNTVVLTATDASMNSDTCHAIVTVLDSIAPTAICQNIQVLIGANGMATITASDVDNGSNDNCSVIVSVQPTVFDCTNAGPNAVVLTATDPSNNSDTCQATVTVIENSDPIAICQNIVVQLDANGMVSITPGDVDGGSTDNCDDPILSADPTDFDCSNIGPNQVMLIAMDNSGNADTCTAIVTVADTIDPTAICTNIDVYVNGAGTVTITVADINNGSTDNCPGPLVSIDVSSFTCANIGTTQTVVLTVTDASNNSDTCQAQVTVLDTISPSCVTQNINIDLDANGMAVVTAAEIDNGSTDNCPPVNLSLDTTMFDCADAGVNIVTLTVSDQSGNTSTCTATVTIDDVAPTATCMDATVFILSNGLAIIDVSTIDAGSGATCGDLDLSINMDTFDCNELGVHIVILTVTDGVGNTSTCSASVTVADTTSPVCIANDLNLFLDDNGMVSVTANDVDNGSSDNCDVALSIDPSAFDCDDTGEQSITLTVTDPSGNSATCISTIMVQDTTKPTCIAMDIQISLDGNGNAMITVNDVNNGSTDNCSPITFGLTPTNFSCDELGQNVVTLTAQDPTGNTSICTSIVTVIDESNLVANCQNLTIFLDINGEAVITPDDIDTGSGGGCTAGGVDLMLDITDFNCGGLGINTVVLTVTDQNMNTATCTAFVTVVDNIDPDIICPANVQVNCDDLNNDLSTYGSPTVSDNCDPLNTVENPVFDLNDCGIGTVTRIFTVTDGSGNTASCTQLISVVNPDPFNASDINFPPALFELNDCASTSPADIPNSQPTISNNNLTCTNVTITFSDVTNNNIDNDPNTLCIEIIRTYRIVDSCQFMPGSNNGVFEFQQTITVQDNTPPQIQNIGNITVTAPENSCEIFVNVNPQITDCGIIQATNDSPFANSNNTGNASGVYPFGRTTVTFTATDQCGNMSTYSMVVRVRQFTQPIFTCAKIIVNMTQELEVTVHAQEFVTIVPGSCSNTDNVLFSFSPTNPFDSLRIFNCGHVGVTTRTLYFFTEFGVFLSSCNTADLELDDNDDFCMDGFAIAGEIENENSLPIENAEVQMEGVSMDPVMTSTEGTYMFQGLSYEGGYEVRPTRNLNHSEGVSTLDMVMIQKHLLGVQHLNSPYKLIAADVTNNGKVTALDLLTIRKLLLGIYSEYPNNDSWRFVHEAFVFPDPFNPWMIPFPESVVLSELETPMTLLNFVGMKVGDVNGSFFNALQDVVVKNRTSESWLTVDNQKIEEDWVEIPVQVGYDQSAIGWQWALDISSNIEWEIVQTHELLDMDNLAETANGLRFSWNDSENIQFNAEEVLVTLRVRSKYGSVMASEIMNLAQSLKPELYVDGEEMELQIIDLSFTNQAGEKSLNYALYQNRPNPFSQQTEIPFSIAESGEVTIKVYQSNGLEIYSNSEWFPMGEQKMTIGSGHFNQAGLYYYTIETEGFTATRKMIKSE